MWTVTPFVEEYTAAADHHPACMLIPGWSFDAAIFEWLLPGLAQHFSVNTAQLTELPVATTKDQLVDALANTIDQPVWLIGWSMGGNIAIDIAARYPEKVLGLCLLATTPRFIADKSWLVGVAPNSFVSFEKGLLKNAEKTLHKFDALQSRGDANEKQLVHALSQYRLQQAILPAEQLAHGLTLLSEFDQREALKQLNVPMLWCFGELDSLINAYTAYEIKQLCPLADVYVFRQASHVLFLTYPDKFFKALLQLLNKKHMAVEKHRIAHSFSKAATTYDSSSGLQQAVAEELLGYVSKVEGYLLDAGCGTGYWLQHLQSKADAVIGLDMAHGMLLYGQQHFPSVSHAVEADLEELPFTDHSISQIFSSLALQWCNNIDVVLDEWHRVLKPGGKMVVATLGEKTLHELRASWSSVDGYDHVNRFMSAEDICEHIYQSPFVLKHMDIQMRVQGYNNVRELLRDLKNIGAQTVLGNEVKGLMGKQRFQQFERAYEQYRNEQGFLPASYEVIYMVLEKHQ